LRVMASAMEIDPQFGTRAPAPKTFITLEVLQ
jgi:hypothetical protein